MSEPIPNLADLFADVQAFVAAQAAELTGLKHEVLGLSLSHATVQKRLKDEKSSVEAALTVTNLPLFLIATLATMHSACVTATLHK